MARRYPRPDFSDKGGMLVDATRLSAVELAKLRNHLPQRMAMQDRAAFLYAVSECVSEWEGILPEPALPQADLLARFDDVTKATGSLQRAIRGLQGQPYEVLAPLFGYLVRTREPVIPLSAEIRAEQPELDVIVDNLWSLLDVMLDLIAHARSQVSVGTTTRPVQDRARFLIGLIARRYRGLFEKYPAAYKDAWFPTFMAELGALLGLAEKFSYPMVAAVIAELPQ